MDKIKPYWDVLSSAASEVGSAFGDALSSITSELGKLTGAFGSTESIQNFSDVINSAKGALTTFAGFLEEHSDIIAKLITQLPKLLVAYKGFKIVKSVTVPSVARSWLAPLLGSARASLHEIAVFIILRLSLEPRNGMGTPAVSEDWSSRMPVVR